MFVVDAASLGILWRGNSHKKIYFFLGLTLIFLFIVLIYALNTKRC